MLYLVRHAKAGDRNEWTGEDWLRPLSRRGQMQALDLLDVFRDVHIDRLISSWYVRCAETLVPLAGERRIAIEIAEPLAEESSLEDALALVRKHAHHDAVFCSHGDVIPMLLEHFASRGLDLGPAPQCAKGSIWVIEFHATGEPLRARYLPPPEGT